MIPLITSKDPEQTPTAEAAAALSAAGWEFVRVATKEDLEDAPPPATGQFIIGRCPEWMALPEWMADPGERRIRAAMVWTGRKGEPVFEDGTDFRVLKGSSSRHATWLPEGWWMDCYPTGLALPNLEHWFRYVFNVAKDEHIPVVSAEPPGPDARATAVRGMAAHAHMIVRHLGLSRRPGAPSEPLQPLDREGYITHLGTILDFLRCELAGPTPAAAEANGTLCGAGAREENAPNKAAPPKPNWDALLMMPPLNAAEIADALGQPVKNVERTLRYFRTQHDFGFIEDEDAGTTEARFRYKMPDVLTHLLNWYRKRQNKEAKKSDPVGG